ncbi:hypothetical protein BH24PSE2_BH24PSE2_24420 [soil metagenome]
MDKRPHLTLAFLTHAPHSAAEVLEQTEPLEAARFLQQIPAPLAASVIAGMTAWAAARRIELISPDHAAAILRDLAFHDCIGIVRLIAEDRRETIFAVLPDRTANRLHNALSFPVGSVGAWMDPDVPVFGAQTRGGDAMRYVRDVASASHVFVHEDDGKRFVGAVPVPALLRGDAAQPLAELPVQRVRPLSSRASLASVASAAEWDEYLMLPVANRRGTMVGALSRASLRRGLQQYHPESGPLAGPLIGHLCTAFGTTCAGLLRVFMGTPRVRHEEARHA